MLPFLWSLTASLRQTLVLLFLHVHNVMTCYKCPLWFFPHYFAFVYSKYITILLKSCKTWNSSGQIQRIFNRFWLNLDQHLDPYVTGYWDPIIVFHMKDFIRVPNRNNFIFLHWGIHVLIWATYEKFPMWESYLYWSHTGKFAFRGLI